MNPEIETNCSNPVRIGGDQNGSAMVIALFILLLVSVFAALAMSRMSAEAAAIGNETAEGKTFYAAQGSLELMTRNFDKIFETKLNPLPSDIDAVRNGTVFGFDNYTFAQEVDRTSDNTSVVLNGGPYSGLYALRDNWRLRSTATDNTGVQVQLSRNILNNRIPIFQFGIFYDDDLELFRPPRFSFGGRVHSNRHFFVSPGAEGVYFDSRVTAVKHVVTQTWRNGYTGDSANAQTWIKNASGVFKQLVPANGSVLNTASGSADNIFAGDPDMPPSKINPNFDTQNAIFDGNLQHAVRPLRLPLKIGADIDLIEMVRRGHKPATEGEGGDMLNSNQPVTAETADNDILRGERFANRTGIRISLADSKSKLPGCAAGVGSTAVVGLCGVRLDGHWDGRGGDHATFPQPAADLYLATRGYQPKPMKTAAALGTFDYVSTRANGERLYSGGTRQVWIKVETVRTDPVTGGIVTADITQDFLSLGITEQAPNLGGAFDILNYDETAPGSSLIATSAQAPSTGTDSRSVIKLQRWIIPGPVIPSGATSYLTSFSTGGNSYNSVVRYRNVDSDDEVRSNCLGAVCDFEDADPNVGREYLAHVKRASVNGDNRRTAVPFPIEMFDTREGEHYDERSATYYSNLSKLTRNGVMSMIDIDVANLRRFLRGDFDGTFPIDTPFAVAKGSGLRASDIPQKEGWVLYVSDRRGDEDFDGEFDMEDIYGAGLGNDGVMQLGEDANRNGVLNTLFGTEAERYNTNTIFPDEAAVNDHKYFRRGVRLINGTVLPGIYDSATPTNTRGFTVSSENGVYVRGNYNATAVASVPATGNTPYSDFLPFNSSTHIPASIVADSVTVLSNAWNDAKSFASPYDEGGRLATTTQTRFAMIAGDTIASKEASPNQGGISPRLNGGVHNFKRFLERWTGTRLDYCGSLINLYNSRNNTGSFKCCNTVYDPPTRNWVFDSTFLDPNRLPPGTPFFQYVQTTGFQRVND